MTGSVIEKLPAAIEGLKHCLKEQDSCHECPYYDGCWADGAFLADVLHKDALEILEALLKEQEPLEPKREVRGCVPHFYCARCGLSVDDSRDKYCPRCGKAVKWK